MALHGSGAPSKSMRSRILVVFVLQALLLLEGAAASRLGRIKAFLGVARSAAQSPQRRQGSLLLDISSSRRNATSDVPDPVHLHVRGIPNMTAEEIVEEYDHTKDMLRNRSSDYVRIDSAMHELGGGLVSNSTTLNVTVDRNIDDLATAVDIAEDQYKTMNEDIVAQAHLNHSDTLMTARGSKRHAMTPEMKKVHELEDELHVLKRQSDAIFGRWMTSDLTHTPTSPPVADLGTAGGLNPETPPPG